MPGTKTAEDLTTVQSSPRSFRWARPLRVFAWLSFLAETIIIGTGGAVRLTGSGLGCSEWPLCTAESLVPMPEQGIHGAIEFGNRTMTGVVGLLAIAVLVLTLLIFGGKHALFRALRLAGAGVVLAIAAGAIAAPLNVAVFPVAVAVLLLFSIVAAIVSVRTLPKRRDLGALAWTTVVGVIAQGFVGGVTVLTGLNPFIVGFHYVASLVLVCVTTAFLVRLDFVRGTRILAVPLWFVVLVVVTGVVLATTIFFGVLTTGSGPHSGDADVLRRGFDATVLAHVHSWPGYILATLTVAAAVSAWVLRLEPRKWLLVLVTTIGVQVGVGVLQAREGLPPLLVGIHMVLAALSAAVFTVVAMHLTRASTASPPSVEGS